MKKVLIGLLVVIVILVVAVVALPFVVPTGVVTAQLVERVKAATGRDLRIEGPVKLSVLPRLEIGLAKVSFANAPGAAAKDMAQLERLQVELGLWPLLSGNVVVDRFVLDRPVIALEVDKQGKPNWVFAEAGAVPPAAPGAPPKAAAPAGGGGASSLQDIRLGDVKLVKGRVSYMDHRTGKGYELDDIDLAVKLPSLDAPLDLDGDVTWQKEKLTLKATVDKPRALMDGKESGTAIRLASAPINFDYKGVVTASTPPKVGGDIDLKIPSIRKLADWTGNPIKLEGTGLGPLAIAGKLAMEGAKIAFTGAKLSLDEIKGTGEVAVDATGAKPRLQGKLDLDKLDVNPYLPPEKQASAPGAPAGAANPTGAAPPAAPTKASDWSDDPIDASGLKAADADFALSVGGIRFRKIEIGKSALDLLLKDGRLTADLKQLELYKGGGKAKIVLDGSGAGAGIQAGLDFAKIEAEPLLRDAIDLDRLSGTGAIQLDLDGKGKSQREIVSALAGKGAVAFTDGSIKGINLAAMLRNVTTAFTDSGGSQKTDFSELGGTFTIAKGIVTNKDLALKSPLLRIEGAGTVDLPKRTVDYRVTPKAVASLEGQGGRSNVGGIMVPVIVQGPWDKLSYRPDLGSLIEQKIDPSKLLEQLQPKAPGTTTTPGQAAPAAPSTNPRDLLKGLLGK